PWMRAGPLLAGVAAAYAYRSPSFMRAIARARVGSAVGLAIAIVICVAATHWPLFVTGSRAIEVAYLACFRAAFGVGVAFGILIGVSEHPVGRVLGRWLSSRALYPFSQLAYSAYLLNPIVTNVVDHVLAPFVWIGKANPMALFLPFDFAGTFVSAAVLHVLVERPFMRMRPRS
ncbi:MAG: hypothetical protein ACRELB_20215, partial [Polyangiaceae bacterium]